MDFNNINPNLTKLAELLNMAAPKPSHGYTISEAGPEIVTAPGVYFPAEKGEVIPLQSRAEGGTVLPPEEELQFQNWYANYVKQLGLNPNPDDPKHFYDYRSAFKAGATPDQTGHWPSQFKQEGHPNLFINGMDTRTGLPMESRKEGGPVSPNSSDTEKEKLEILREIISQVKPRQGTESRQTGGPVSPDSKPPIMDQIEKTKYDIFKSAISALKPQKQQTNTGGEGNTPLQSRQQGGSVRPGILEELLFTSSLPTTPSLPSLPKPITSSSYGMMPEAMKPGEGESLWQKKQGGSKAGVLDLTSRQYGGFVSPDLEELKKRKLWEEEGYPKKRLEEVRNILGPSVLGVQPGFQENYYETHPEEKLMDEEAYRMKPFTEAITKAIAGEESKAQGYGVGFGPTPMQRRLGLERKEPSQIPELVQGLKGLTPTLVTGGRRGILPAGVTTPKLTTETNEDKYSVSMYNKMYRDLSGPERETVDIKIKGNVKPPAETEMSLFMKSQEKGPDGKSTLSALQAKKQLDDYHTMKEGGIPPMSPEVANIPSVKGVKNELAIEGLSEQEKSTIRGLSNYQYPWPGAFALSKPVWAQRMARLQKYDPDFSAAEYQTRFNIRKSFTSGKDKDKILGLNTATGHINSLVNAAKDLANSDWPVENAATNILAQYLPITPGLIKRQGLLSAIKTKFNAVADEMASIFKQNNATDTAIKNWRDTIKNPETATPEMWKGFINGALELMGSRIKALGDVYETGMGKWKDFPIMSESSKNILRSLPEQYKTFDIDETDRVMGGTTEKKVIERRRTQDGRILIKYDDNSVEEEK